MKFRHFSQSLLLIIVIFLLRSRVRYHISKDKGKMMYCFQAYLVFNFCKWVGTLLILSRSEESFLRAFLCRCRESFEGWSNSCCNASKWQEKFDPRAQWAVSKGGFCSFWAEFGAFFTKPMPRKDTCAFFFVLKYATKMKFEPLRKDNPSVTFFVMARMRESNYSLKLICKFTSASNK